MLPLSHQANIKPTSTKITTPRAEAYVFPSESGFAVFTINICYGVQARQKNSLFRRTTAHVHPARERERGGDGRSRGGFIECVMASTAKNRKMTLRARSWEGKVAEALLKTNALFPSSKPTDLGGVSCTK